MSKKTSVYKDIKGWDWTVTTLKNHRGILASHATACKISTGGGFTMSEWSMSDPSISLCQSPATRATEKAINELHNMAILKFENLRDTDQLPENKAAKVKDLPMYAKLMTYSQGMSNTPAAIIGMRDNGRGGKVVKYVTLTEYKTPMINESDHVKSNQNIFGIGTYFLDPIETYEEREVLPYIEKAEAAAKQRREEREAEKARLKEIDEKGKALLGTIPTWAKAAIIAEYIVDDSDPMTDYFASHADDEKTAILSWSANDRNNEHELRTAAASYEHTAELVDTMELERGNSYNYCIRQNYNSGWKVRKLPFNMGMGFNITQNGVIIGALGRRQNFAPVDEPTPVEATPSNTGAYCKINTEKQGIEIYFTIKPQETVLQDLKLNGFRWAKFNKCWYKKDSQRARDVVSKYAPLPDAGQPQGNDSFDLDSMLEQQAEDWSNRN